MDQVVEMFSWWEVVVGKPALGLRGKEGIEEVAVVVAGVFDGELEEACWVCC
jgi:hypothetical protein